MSGDDQESCNAATRDLVPFPERIEIGGRRISLAVGRFGTGQTRRTEMARECGPSDLAICELDPVRISFDSRPFVAWAVARRVALLADAP